MNPTQLFAVKCKGFTLVELLVVMAIIVILAGMTAGISSYATRAANERRIKSEIEAMATALEAYKQDYGGYPPLDDTVFNSLATNFPAGATNDAWTNNFYIYRALSKGPKVYWQIPSKIVITNLVGMPNVPFLQDATGKLYGYNPRFPKANPQSFDLFSVGIDGKPAYPTNLSENVDDIGNWNR